MLAKLNGHATGLGATLALFCDVVFGNRSAKIGGPHVLVGHGRRWLGGELAADDWSRESPGVPDDG
ncbi:hypothetical protein [Advenella incenata]|uniref:hypothetical protein n=1 Tax=Advenella incenata TaxID=267800 RepID=UPI003BF78E8C